MNGRLNPEAAVHGEQRRMTLLGGEQSIMACIIDDRFGQNPAHPLVRRDVADAAGTGATVRRQGVFRIPAVEATSC